jgi:class 3 adenylate cyclase
MELVNPGALPPDLRGRRVLAAIVFTDIATSGTRMAIAERHTLNLIHRDFQLMTRLCERFEGQVLKTLGDGLLMYFASAVQAVECAQEIQRTLAEKAAILPPQDVLYHRIGIHLGDVLFSETDVMGNGVNIAARLQTEAKPGGICLSQTIYDVVKSCLDFKVDYLGLRQLKNIREALPIYQIPPAAPNKYSSKHASKKALPTARLARVFISYRSHDPDLSLARELHAGLQKAGHASFMAGESIHLGEGWTQRIDEELKQADYFLLLLSAQSATSEMVTEEVRRARELRDSHPGKKPIILPIRVNFPLTSPLNYDLRGYLNQIQQREWQSSGDTPVLLQEILDVLAREEAINHQGIGVDKEAERWGVEELLERKLLPAPPEMKLLAPPSSPEVAPDPEPPPLPAAEPELPEGQVDLASTFYLERHPIESRCYETIVKPGSLIRIKAPRQMGKTSLMARILQHAAQQEFLTVPLSFQLADGAIFADLDRFLRWFCASVGRRLGLPNRLVDFWDEIFGSKDNCTAYFEEYLLPRIGRPIVLGLDEVDCVFQHPEIAADFFALLRAWHEDAKNRDIWKRLRLIVVHSTEVYIPLNINQSPFNVGLPIELPEFSPEQVMDLANRHHLNWDKAAVEKLMAMVGGHPYLVRVALYHIARQDITLDQLLRIAPTEAGLYGDHLRRHLWNLEQQPKLSNAMKKVVTSISLVRLEATQAFQLQSMGLVHLRGNDVVPRCNLYRQYFRDRLRVIR